MNLDCRLAFTYAARSGTFKFSCLRNELVATFIDGIVLVTIANLDQVVLEIRSASLGYTPAEQPDVRYLVPTNYVPFATSVRHSIPIRRPPSHAPPQPKTLQTPPPS